MDGRRLVERCEAQGVGSAQAAQPEVWAMVCVDPPGFDRAEFQRGFNAEVVRFFRETLKVPAAQ